VSEEGWTTVTLGDIAENISVRVDDPSKSGLDRFVGLVHLDSGSVTVSRWDSAESVTSSMKRFEAGDILLARRNAHLRRASAVGFGGVCSGDAYVLREKPGAIVPGLLKYILNTNRFWEYAIANADGSMSTRVKYRNLESFSLDLPPISRQKGILELLNCASKLEEANTQIHENSSITYEKSLSELFAIDLRTKTWRENSEMLGNADIFRLADLADISFSNVDKKTRVDENRVLLCNYMDVYSNDYINDGIEFMEASAKELQIKRFRLLEGDILATKDSETPDDIGVPAMVRDLNQQIICGYHLAVIRIKDDRVNKNFFFHYMKSSFVKSYFKMMAQGSTRFALGKQAFESLPVPILASEKQQHYAKIFDSLLTVVSGTENSELIIRLQKQLIELLLGGE